MKKLNFKIQINAPKTKVWTALWNDQNYRKWTSVFAEGSYANTNWQEGSRVQFLNQDGDGIYGTIEKNIPNTQMSFKYIGEVKKQKESNENTDWAGASENYFLKEDNNKTELNVEMEATDEFKDYFSDKFPKALQVVKEISEGV